MAGLKQLNWASEGVGATAAALVDLSTVAGNKISNPPWVKFQSAGWVNFPSAPTSNEHPAAKLASEFTADGHNDFYLPARRELQVSEANVPELFEKAYHWSSSQRSADFAYIMDFEGGWLSLSHKSNEFLVRPVRRFIP